jgi:hypothetical protein
MVYKEGSIGSMVKQIQETLRIAIDGNFGPKTKAAVVNYQMDNNLVADGIVGRKTLDVMGILDTDLKQAGSFHTGNGLNILIDHLPKGEYIQNEAPILNDYVFIHHTAGWHNPHKTIASWGRDTRGRIATEFVMGGQSIKGNDDRYDGVTVQAFPEGCQGWHLGATKSYYMNRHSVGIELCGFGYLTKEGKTYVGGQAVESQIVELAETFRGYAKWHKYSEKQINNLRKLLLYIASRDNIDLQEGLVQWIHKMGVTKAFGFQQDACEGKIKGLLTHTNVRKGKTDCFPQQELIDMLLSL